MPVIQNSTSPVAAKSSPNPTQVLVIGEALADVFPTEVIIGGAPFNVARHLAQLGCESHLMSRLAQDEIGHAIVESAKQFGVGLSLTAQECTTPSGKVAVRLGADGSHQFQIERPSAWDFIDAPPPAWFLDNPVKAIVFGTLSVRGNHSRLALDDLLKQVRSMPSRTRPLVVCDLNWRSGHTPIDVAVDFAVQADWLKLSEEEWSLLAQYLSLDESEPDALLDLYSIQQLIITRGAEGYVCFGKSEKEDDLICIEGPAAPINHLVDTVGAGDSFLACTLATYLQGQPLHRALALAAEFASAICGVRGAVPPNLDFYKPFQQRLVS
ncbi:MAG: PfkB family carbohydrate kinase [Limnobacter sp.]|nr:PfkB family carbohydrate kinase [Limnobacter sp.]